MVSIPACHAGDPGSIPGLGVNLFDSSCERFSGSKKAQVLPGLEPGLQGSKPWVLTNYTIEPRIRHSLVVPPSLPKSEAHCLLASVYPQKKEQACPGRA